MQKGQVKLKEATNARRWNGKKIGKEKRQATSRKSSKTREKKEVKSKCRSAVTVKSNRNLLMKFTLVTIKLSGLLVY